MVKVYRTLIFCALLFVTFQQLSAQKIYFTENGGVKVMNLDGSGVQLVVGGSNYNFIAVDGDLGFLFYNDTQSSYRAFLNGSSPALITSDGAFAGYSNYAVIPDYESLVYCGISDDMDDIWYGNYYDDPSSPPTRIVNGITMGGDEEYLDVTYNKSNEKIYFSGYNNVIYSSDLDGASASIVVPSNAYGPIGVDYINGKIFWVRYLSSNYYVMTATLTGGSPTTILSNGATPIESLDVYPEQNAVFFTQADGVYKMNLAGGGNTLLYSGLNIYNVAIDFDITPPIFYTLSPADGAASVSVSTNLTMTFNENLKRSIATSGTVDDYSLRIYKTTGDVLMETVDRSSAKISIANNVLTISGLTTLDYNTDYYVLAGGKAFSDLTDNDWIGISTTTGWNFKTGPDPSLFYSRQNGNWNSPSTWSHVSHTGPASMTTPGTGSDVVIGNGNTVILTGNTSVVGSTTTGTWIKSGATLDAATFDFNVWGTLRIDGQFLNAGALTGTFNLYATGGIPIFDAIKYGVVGLPNAPSNIYTNVVALNGTQVINGGTLNTNGFQICVPPSPPPTNPVFSNKTSTSVTLSWTAGGANAFVVVRAGATSFKPVFGAAYTASAAFGSGSQIGTGNYVVYNGSGTSVTVTGLTAATYYEFDMYSFNTTIGGCYTLNNYQFASVGSCIIIAAPSNPINAQYCAGDTKPAINVNSPGSGRNILWYDGASAGNLVTGDVTGGDGRGGVFIPTVSSGTFYAEIYDGTLQCPSSTRTAVTLTLNPALVPGVPSSNQSVCTGGDPTVINGGTASGGTGTYTYQWESSTSAAGPYSALLGETQATYDPPAGITQTTYFHRVARSATCLQPGSPVAVTVSTPPLIITQPTSQQTCTGKSATFSIAASGTALTYQWQSDNGGSFSNINNSGVYSGALTNQLQISNVVGLNNVRFHCVVSSGGSCPVTSSTVPLIVNPAPVVVNQMQAICEGTAGSGIGTVDLTALNAALTNNSSGLSVTWFTNVGLTNPVANASAASANNNTTFYANVTNNATTCTSSGTATITVNKKPAGNGNISGPLSLCTNAPATFTVSGVSNALQYQWQVPSGLEIVSQTGTTAIIRALSGTGGKISVIGENSCGTGGLGGLGIQILPAPDFDLMGPGEIIIGELASFSFASSNPSFKNIEWSFGDKATTSEESPQHQYSMEGTYQVSLAVIDNAECGNTKEITITVLPIPELGDANIKNVITANGDSQNGVLYIMNIEKYPSNEVVLLDRWGVEVFRKDNYVNDWDARKNGEFLPAGQYVCVVKLNETGKIYSRTVSIIKR